MDPIANPPIEESMLEFYVRAIGPGCGALLMLAGLVALVLTVALVVRGRGDSLAPALLLIVPLPMLVGGLAGVNRLIATYGIMAASDTRPEQSLVCEMLASAFLPLLMGLSLCVPIALLATVVGVVRSLSKAEQV